LLGQCIHTFRARTLHAVAAVATAAAAAVCLPPISIPAGSNQEEGEKLDSGQLAGGPAWIVLSE
jgi:hypothetical protein